MSNVDGVRCLNADRMQFGRISKVNGWRLSPQGRQTKAFKMNQASKEMRKFAKRLMDHEAFESRSSKTIKSAFRVSDKLRPYLSTLMGTGGFRALLSRALTLAAEEVSWLRNVQVNADGSLGGLEEAHSKMGSDQFFEGRVVLLAQLLGLMAAFIGEILTLRLVHEVWPTVPLNDLDFEDKGKK